MAIKLGKIYGIPILLDYSWFIIFFLIAWTVGFALMPSEYPGLSSSEYLFIGILSSVLLFVSVLLHELAHSIVAKRNNLKIANITLFLFGGVSAMEEEPSSPQLELKMSSAGPLTSLALAGLVEIAYLFSVYARFSALIQAPLQYIAYFNFIVALFNLLPAFPMDGGRVLRSLIWMRNKDIFRSTKTASTVGQWIAYAMMFIGFFFVFAVDLLDGLWFILIGWFISSSAKASMGQVIIERDLQKLTAADIMSKSIDSVDPEMSLNDLSQEIFQKKHNGFPVISGGELQGCVTSHDLRKIRKERWADIKVKEIMTPKVNLITLKEGDHANSAISLMNSKRIGRVFVVNELGKLTGIITRTDILRTVQMQEVSRQTQGVTESFEGMRRTFVAEKGMFFVIEQELGTSVDLMAEFDHAKLRLADAKISESAGRKTKQFVFEILESGVQTVFLKPIAASQPVNPSR